VCYKSNLHGLAGVPAAAKKSKLEYPKTTGGVVLGITSSGDGGLRIATKDGKEKFDSSH